MLKRIGAGNRMTTAIIVGNEVHLSGFVSDAPEGKSVAEQTSNILAQIDTVLAEAGTDKTKIYKALIWLTDMNTWAEMNTIWDAWVVPGETPCRAAVESPKLAGPAFSVEIMVDAVL